MVLRYDLVIQPIQNTSTCHCHPDMFASIHLLSTGGVACSNAMTANRMHPICVSGSYSHILFNANSCRKWDKSSY